MGGRCRPPQAPPGRLIGTRPAPPLMASVARRTSASCWCPGLPLAGPLPETLAARQCARSAVLWAARRLPPLTLGIVLVRPRRTNGVTLGAVRRRLHDTGTARPPLPVSNSSLPSTIKPPAGINLHKTSRPSRRPMGETTTVGAKATKKRRRGQPPLPAGPPTTVAPPTGASSMHEFLLCFNCGLSGHFQVACPNPLMCYLCKDSGHPAVLCPDQPLLGKCL